MLSYKYVINSTMKQIYYYLWITTTKMGFLDGQNRWKSIKKKKNRLSDDDNPSIAPSGIGKMFSRCFKRIGENHPRQRKYEAS